MKTNTTKQIDRMAMEMEEELQEMYHEVYDEA